jgi:hypothetical protein
MQLDPKWLKKTWLPNWRAQVNYLCKFLSGSFLLNVVTPKPNQ